MKMVAQSPPQTPPQVVSQSASIVPESSADNHERNSLDQEETSVLMEFHTQKSEPRKWTNAKHSLFLDSMEAAFIHHLHNSRSGFRKHSKTSPSFQENNKSNLSSSDLSLEGTDQNFIDDEKKIGSRSSKRMKMAEIPNHDQVVPTKRYSYTEIVAENNVASKA